LCINNTMFYYYLVSNQAKDVMIGATNYHEIWILRVNFEM